MNKHKNKYAHLAPAPPRMPPLASQHKEKVRFGHLEAARRAAAHLAAREGLRFNCYVCPVCGWYHVGRAPQGS